MRILKTYSEIPLLNHYICNGDDEEFFCEKFPQIRKDIWPSFCEYLKENKLCVGIIDCYDIPFHWKGSHFYVGNKKQKYSERPDLSINGFKLSTLEISNYIKGIVNPRWKNHK